MKKRALRFTRNLVRTIVAPAAFAALGACGGTMNTVPASDAAAETSSLEASAEASTSADGPESCVIDTSSYDQSCSVDSDCAAGATFPNPTIGDGIQSGNYCTPMMLCGGEAINKRALAQFVADVSRTPLGSGTIKVRPSTCLAVGTSARCVNGRCEVGLWAVPYDAGPEPDAGTMPEGGVLCGLHSGPIDGGDAGSEPALWCMGAESSCTPFNGGYACCQPTPPGGGLLFCSIPFMDAGARDAGVP